MRKLKKYKSTKFMAKDSHYDADAADFAVAFIESLCHTKGTWAGKPFELIAYEGQIIRDSYQRCGTTVAVAKELGISQATAARMREKELEAERLRGESQRQETAIGELESQAAVLRTSITHNTENAARIREEITKRESREESLTQQTEQLRRRLEETGDQLKKLSSNR